MRYGESELAVASVDYEPQDDISGDGEQPNSKGRRGGPILTGALWRAPNPPKVPPPSRWKPKLKYIASKKSNGAAAREAAMLRNIGCRRFRRSGDGELLLPRKPCSMAKRSMADALALCQSNVRREAPRLRDIAGVRNDSEMLDLVEQAADPVTFIASRLDIGGRVLPYRRGPMTGGGPTTAETEQRPDEGERRAAAVCQSA